LDSSDGYGLQNAGDERGSNPEQKSAEENIRSSERKIRLFEEKYGADCLCIMLGTGLNSIASSL
jgi:hypothetical protein